jgi:hypothetical protein
MVNIILWYGIFRKKYRRALLFWRKQLLVLGTITGRYGRTFSPLAKKSYVISYSFNFPLPGRKSRPNDTSQL